MCVRWFGSDIGLRRLLVAVNLCSVSFVCVCVCAFGSDIGLHWLLVAVSLCSVSVLCVGAYINGLDQISGFDSYL